MIVIEGPDGSGKTTFRDRLLAEVDGLSLVKRHCDTDGPVTNLTDWVDRDLRYLPDNGHLYDRHALISEPIYGPTVRGEIAPGFDTTWYAQAWDRFLAFNPIIIICLPPLEVVQHNVLSGQRQMEGVAENTTKIYLQYKTLALRLMGISTNAGPYIYNYLAGSTDQFPLYATMARNRVNNGPH